MSALLPFACWRVVSSLLLAGLASFQDAKPAPLRLECNAAKPVAAERVDLALAYLRVQRALVARMPMGEELAQANAEFDAATLAFFLGRTSDATERLDQLHAQLLGRAQDSALLLASSLRLTLEHKPTAHGQKALEVWRLQSLYWPELAQTPRELLVSIGRSGTSQPRLELQLVLPQAEPAGLSAVLPGELMPEGTNAEIELRTADGLVLCAVRSQPLQGTAADWQELVREAEGYPLEPGAGEDTQAKRDLAEAWRIFADRARRAALPPSRASTRFLFVDLDQYWRDMTQERQALLEARDPYAVWVGDLWRTIQVGEQRVPTRLWIPQHEASERLSLVIAFHGMGADEDFFFDGAGRFLPQTAAKNGFLLVAPQAYPFAGTAKAFDDLLRELLRTLPVDPARIYVVGHSFGAQVVARLQRERGHRLAAAVCIAGAGDYGPRPPVLALAGARDRIVPLAGIVSSVERARAAGYPATLEIYPDQGHTLLLLEALPRALKHFGLLREDGAALNGALPTSRDR